LALGAKVSAARAHQGPQWGVRATTLVYGSEEVSELHDTGDAHPERPLRLTAFFEGLRECGLGDAIERRPSRVASQGDLLRVHSGAYMDEIRGFIAAGGRVVDADTIVSEGSWEAAAFAAGAGLSAVEDLRAGVGRSAFVAVRPPGHHASSAQAMGFCLLNNIAVTAAALTASGERVLIVDWDVHHGNGTQDIFWDDPQVLFVSTHEWPLYPGTGRATETGGASAPGLTLNVPLPSGTTGDVARMVLDEVVAPAVDRFDPTWVLVSCGFDAHRDDPLADLAWSSGDYADLTTAVAQFAPGPQRLIMFLEGGYSLPAVRDSSIAVLTSLSDTPVRPEPPTAGGPGRDAVRRALELQRQSLESHLSE